MSDKSIQQNLAAFGLNTIEISIYLYLLNKEPKTILEISRDLRIARTSIYDACVRLSEKGLIERVVEYKSQKIKASPLISLQHIIDREKLHVESLEKTYSDLENDIKISQLPVTSTQVRYYHGAQGFMQMMWNALSAKGETVGYSQFGRADIVGSKFVERLHEENQKRKIKDRVISNPTKQVLHLLSNKEELTHRLYQETRFIDPSIIYISGDTTIYNNIFAVTYWDKGEVVGIEIENQELVKTQKTIFEQMWKLTKPLSTFI